MPARLPLHLSLSLSLCLSNRSLINHGNGIAARHFQPRVSPRAAKRDLRSSARKNHQAARIRKTVIARDCHRCQDLKHRETSSADEFFGIGFAAPYRHCRKPDSGTATRLGEGSTHRDSRFGVLVATSLRRSPEDRRPDSGGRSGFADKLCPLCRSAARGIPDAIASPSRRRGNAGRGGERRGRGGGRGRGRARAATEQRRCRACPRPERRRRTGG
jgi:hypothetical protein